MKKHNLYIISIKHLVAAVTILVVLFGTAVVNIASGSEKVNGGVTEAPQAFIVTGKVTSATDNSTLAGVTIVVKGTTKGTISGNDGSYTIEVPGNDATLVFSFIGFQTLEVPLDGRRSLNITMTGEVKALDEVVVTALGITRKEKSIGYSVGKVDGAALVRVTQENAINSLAGKVSGVQEVQVLQ
jgi:hypothetical protein